MCLLGAAALLATPRAQAQVFQTDAAKTPLPQPVGMNEMNLVTQSWAYERSTQVNVDATGTNVNQMNVTFGSYYPTFVDGDAITLQGLFKFRGEKIDPVKDAHTAPGYFSPTCGFTGQFVLHGGNCEITFGWYNVADPNSTTAPAANEIYPFIPTTGSTFTKDLQCQPPLDNGFCPLAWDNVNPRDLSQKAWTPKMYDSGAIKTDPRYKGGFVGFAVIGNPNSACTQTKYSMYAYNQKNASGTPWVTALIYQSTVDPSGFYMAFEDLAMSPADWHSTGVPGNNATNDGDFNDFVFYVSGINCEGGNQPCMTGLQGACSVGHTDCSIGGAPAACRPLVQPGVETCDNVDNDCDGVVDNGDGLCPNPDTPICFQGTCVGTCVGGEFPCPGGSTCDSSGHCVDPACATVSCPAGTACRAGNCVDPCGGVTCPTGSLCELGRCVDPCAGVTCPTQRVCDKGLCVADCNCGGCTGPQVCGMDGKCADPGCAGVPCSAAEICKQGTCVDRCVGAVCPGGAACTGGMCGPAGSGGGITTTIGQDGGLITSSGGSATVGGNGLNFGGTSSSTGGTSSTGPRLSPAVPAKGCACRVGQTSSDRTSSLAWLAAALGLGVTTWARRRRQH
jgi:MYXO-CTERM domain-containing protein